MSETLIKTLSQECSADTPLTLRPIQCEVWRGEVLESLHEVHAALVNDRGELLASAGEANLITTARSSLKPFQLWPTLRLGARERFGLSLADLALMCASHNGESRHIRQCAQLLQKLEMSEDALECGAHLPYDQDAAHELIRAGASARAIHNNCSGKHCGMLASRALLKSEGSYLDANHPTQLQIFKGLEQLLGSSKSWTWGIDGCSLPTPAISLHDFARLFAYLAAGRSPHEASSADHFPMIFEAMSAHPELVAGSGRFDTAFMRAARGRAVCKVGGEAIRGFALRDQAGRSLGLVLKVRDGAMRALHPASLALLERFGLIERPATLSATPPQELKGLDRFWSSPETNWAGRDALKIKSYIQGV